MPFTVRAMFAAFLLSLLIGACYSEQGSEENASDPSMLIATTDGCTATITCGSCTTLSCSGSTSTSCSTTTISVTCNGVTQSCQTCTFNGQTYTDGQNVSTGVHCSSKVDGVCVGGVFAGKSCVASGECYATCCNGTWVNQ